MTAPHRITGELARFLAVGGAAFLIEAGVATVLVYGIPGILPAPLPEHPLPARAIATLAAMAAAWAGNRLLTYRGSVTVSPGRSIVRFTVANLIAMGLALLPLAFTWYALGLRDPLSFTISGTVVGTLLAMAYRFHAYRTWVFVTERPAQNANSGGPR